MITDAILGFFDLILSGFIALFPSLPNFQLPIGIYEFIANAYRFMNLFFDMGLIWTYVVIAINMFLISLIMRIFNIIRG